ncbi:MAG: superoxide dismutase [Agriterribacter sp.]
MNNNNALHRRKFIKQSTLAGVAAAFSVPVLSSFDDHKKSTAFKEYQSDINWQQQPLGYAYNAIEPSVDALTMEIHYTKHAATYTKNLTDATAAEHVNTGSTTIEQLLSGISKYSPKMRNNAGGHYNHELFWKTIKTPVDNNKPSAALLKLIEKDFNSFDAFKTQFSDAAKARFGSGWAWLVLTADKKLVVSSTPNQDNPLMDLAETKGFPVLGLDVWEHAYYLKYQNKRPDYIAAWWNAVNWDYVDKRFSQH